jgi:hypothetical protein
MENLKKVVSIAAVLANVSGAALVDGKIGLDDMAHIGQLVMVFPLFAGVDFAKVAEEVKDFDMSDAESLVAHFKESFNIPQDSLEVTIEKVMDIVVRVTALILDLIAVFKTK